MLYIILSLLYLNKIYMHIYMYMLPKIKTYIMIQLYTYSKLNFIVKYGHYINKKLYCNK